MNTVGLLYVELMGIVEILEGYERVNDKGELYAVYREGEVECMGKRGVYRVKKTLE